MRNLTLAVDPELLRAVRKYAVDRDTSVNQLVREYFETLVAPNAEARSSTLVAVLDRVARPRGGQRWSREELNQR